MRLLFYTATGLFVVLAAIFAFYALQSPGPGGPARVVLNIDSEERLTESHDRLAAAESNSAAQSDPFDSRLPVAQDAAEPDRLPSEEQVQAESEFTTDDRERISALSSPPEAATLATPSETDLADAEPAEPSEPAAEIVPEQEAVEQEEPAAESSAPAISGDLFDRAPSPEESAAFVSGVDPRLLEEKSPQQDEAFEPATQAEPDRLPSEAEAPPAEVAAEDASGLEPEVSISESAPSEQAAPQDGLADLRGSAFKEDAARLPSENPAEVQSDAAANGTSDIVSADISLEAEPVDSNSPEEVADAAPDAEAAATPPEETETSRLAALSPAPEDKAAPLSQDESPAPNADSPENDEELKRKFDAFLSSLNEKRSGERATAALLAPPPVPRRRPDDIPAPVRTAAADGWAGNQFSTTDAAVRSSSPRVAIMLRGVGRDNQNSEKAIKELPSAVSLAFMPFAGGAQQWARQARQSGHEVIVQLPLEPSDYPLNNPGSETLLSGSSAGENLSRLRTVLRRFDAYSGVSNYLGGKLLQSEEALRPILERIKADGLIYVGEGNNSHALLRRLAAEIGLRYGGADVMIDSFPAPDAIRQQLDRLAEIARKQGSAIGMGYASRTTIEQVREWSKSAAGKGITLVPVGALAQTPGAT